eukprot:gb/GEZN01006842.1/.p1 GENE.gb/GEZN01006842.1/~~gb/GEZN01006842.1/.p1  ORF type:complete len:476 (-),score=66.87 gb/GEZN01006842.1/:151-1578(-)
MRAFRSSALCSSTRSLLTASPASPAISTRLSREYHVQFRKPDPSKPRLVLAYSGGLDTSCQLAYLTQTLGMEVCAYIADLGQDDLNTQAAKDAVRDKAKQSGAYAYYCEDVKDEFVRDYILEYFKCGTLYEKRYLLGTSIARPCIGKRQVEIATKEQATHVSHGSTGKGNDQVRFELCYLAMDPKLKIVTLWRDPTYCKMFQGRQDLIDFATKAGIPVGASKKHSYSEDENCMHISYESGELEDPAFPGNKHEYPGLVLKKKTVDIKDAPEKPVDLRVHFEKGKASAIEGPEGKFDFTKTPFLAYDYLNKVAGKHGVGRADLVENRYVGLKSRGCYETPAGTVLYAALTDLEILCMDREVMRLRDQLGLKYAENVYNGYWFSPEMDFLRNSMDYASRATTGQVDVRLNKGNVMCRGRSSPNSLYSMKMVSMDEHGGFDPTAGTGFIATLSNRLKAVRARDEKAGLLPKEMALKKL